MKLRINRFFGSENQFPSIFFQKPLFWYTNFGFSQMMYESISQNTKFGDPKNLNIRVFIEIGFELR